MHHVGRVMGLILALLFPVTLSCGIFDASAQNIDANSITFPTGDTITINPTGIYGATVNTTANIWAHGSQLVVGLDCCSNLDPYPALEIASDNASHPSNGYLQYIGGGDWVWQTGNTLFTNDGLLTFLADDANGSWLFQWTPHLGNRVTPFQIDSAGDTIQTGGAFANYVSEKPSSVVQLQLCGSQTEGTLRPVVDSPVAAWGTVIATGGGPYHVLAYCDGSAWTVMAQ
jgi:hypothetical protein